MAAWSNWSGRHQATPAAHHFLHSEADVQALVLQVAGTGGTIRVAGAGHSHSPVVVDEGVIADSSGLAGIISTDQTRKQASIWSGSRIYSLGRPLHDLGLALKNQGDIDRQALAGACSTGTHGTGPGLQNLSAAVVGATLVLASGDLVNCSASENRELWYASRLSLGAFGVITRLTMQLRGAYRLRESGFQTTYAELIEQVPTLIAGNERFEFFWYPHNDRATVKLINQTDDPAEYPVAPEGQRCAWNYEVLPNHRPNLHTEMEYSVPAESGLACLDEIRTLLQTKFPDVVWPVEYRTVASDDVWLSMANGRETVTISVHQDVRKDETEYYRACEAIFRRYDGRPHWGKVNYLDGATLAAIHPNWDDWWRVRDQVDPAGLFLNGYLRGVRP